MINIRQHEFGQQQFTTKCLFYFICQLIIISSVMSSADDTVETCWNDTAEENCLIKATLFYGDNGLPMDIKCYNDNETQLYDEFENAEWSNAYVFKRFEKVTSVTLNGCYSSFKDKTSYGLDLLPNCINVPVVTVERFHMDIMQPLKCSPASIHTQNESIIDAPPFLLEILTFRQNEISTIAMDSLAFNLQHLRELHLIGNSLRHIDHKAFDALRVAETLHLENESLLIIKADTADLFERTAIMNLVLITMKRINAEVFKHLPDSLRNLRIENTPIDNNDNKEIVTINNPQTLQNISIIQCSLKSILISDNYSTIRELNLSGNNLEEFYVTCKQECILESIDLSENQLIIVSPKWFEGLKNLKSISFKGNLLKFFNIKELLSISPSISLIDLRANRFSSLTASSLEEEYGFNRVIGHLHLRIDHNPWDCVWLLHFAHTWPERFHLFQYEKFISKINVNGLECSPPRAVEIHEDIDIERPLEVSGPAISTQKPKDTVHVSPLMYPNGYDFKRSQRDEALIIVFMLPLGIAFLFLLLYMWIYCQKMFHLSYYQSMTFMGCKRQRNNAPTLTERHDIVRQMPQNQTAIVTFAPNTNDMYEMPINGVVSECNCNCDPINCSKSHHITYEPIPLEQPYKIYEEIIEDDADKTKDGNLSKNKFYDHLSYTE